MYTDLLPQPLFINLKAKLILYSHDNLHMVQTVQTEVIDKVTLQSKFVSSNLVECFADIKNSGLNI